TSNYDHLFTYDKVGNRTQFNANGMLTNYSHDAADELRQEATALKTTTYRYDANGNQTKKNTGDSIFIYRYDSLNRLIKFRSSDTDTDSNGDSDTDSHGDADSDSNGDTDSNANGDTDSNAATASYTFDALNRRLTKTGGSTTTRFLYDGT